MHRNQVKVRQDHFVPFCVVTNLSHALKENILSKLTKRTNPKSKSSQSLPLRGNTSQFPGWSISEDIKNMTEELAQVLVGDASEVKLHWEREEYELLPTTLWEINHTHAKLKLLKNRYPMVPGYDSKTKLETNPWVVPVIEKPVTLKDFLYKKSTWKVKNLVPKSGTLHHYASKNGRSYPVLKKTALTSRFAGARQAKREAIALASKK